MTVERAWATLRVHEYEKVSSSYGTVSACIVWLVSIAYTAYWGSTYLTYASEYFTDGTIFIVMTVPPNVDFMLNSNYALLLVDLLTSVVDIALLYSNVRRLRRIAPNYTLSGSYQANENVLVTTRLMLPLDVSNSVLYLTFLILSAYFRAVALAHPLATIITIFEWFWLANFLQMAVGLVIMVQFGRRPKRAPTVIAQEDHSSVYFQRFREQLGHEAAPLRDSC
ncbi:hypothetical protein AAVH_26076 [Aphelenchoides avenae]|nr:hypothetical protein AAVH_26076 [Aphelenchus avenae]